MSRILVIAGTDSSGGAGLSRDIAMAASMGCSVSPVVTAVTVQTNAALIASHPVPPEIIGAQVRAAFAPGGESPRAVKIGMIGTPEAARQLVQALPQGIPIVLDPVLKSSSGGELMTAETLRLLLERVTLLTPNLQESARLSAAFAPPDMNAALTQPSTAEPTQDPETLHWQADQLRATGVQAVLIKGGHGRGTDSTDHLYASAGHSSFAAPRLPVEKRGTGCSLATAIACALAQGNCL
ncbi:hydroxymethylpyrimidine/phosphomethylpyrimidine kinase, partial [Pseudophaeobacter sp.]|uniref:bifunctional hydroxymethylpyrimidine kinase/phosphomethylpyrimidine kinase n=1 Tax=Pseudophaeobacter sp. TaxID=1971739 RepID=UPI003298A1A1